MEETKQEKCLKCGQVMSDVYIYGPCGDAVYTKIFNANKVSAAYGMPILSVCTNKKCAEYRKPLITETLINDMEE